MPNSTLRCTERLFHVDLLRILAIFLVIFNHTSDRGYMLFVDKMGSSLYFPYMTASILCKVAVPIFFMISGALLLPKKESLGKLFSQRILRMVTILLLISVPYYAWLHRAQGLSISNFLTYIYSNSASTSLWYLYSYIALLLMMPFLRSMVKGMKESDFQYLVWGYIAFFGIMPCLEFFLWKGHITVHYAFNPVLFMVPNIFYALVGYYLEHVLDLEKVSNKKFLVGLGVCFVALGATCFITHYQTQLLKDCTTEQVERFFNCFICIPAMLLYMIMKRMCSKLRDERVKKILPALGDAVFGIYLIEKFTRALTDSVYVLLAPVVGAFAAALIWVFASWSVSLIVILLLKKMPVVKNVVNRFI